MTHCTATSHHKHLQSISIAESTKVPCRENCKDTKLLWPIP